MSQDQSKPNPPINEMGDKEFFQSLRDAFAALGGEASHPEHIERLDNIIAGIPTFWEQRMTGVENPLANADGSLKLERLHKELSSPDGLEGVLQHIMLHHTHHRQNGTSYVMYGSACRDAAEVIRESGVTHFPKHTPSERKYGH